MFLSRKDLSESQKTCEDLEGRLKHQKSLVSATHSSRVGGLCLKCAQHEAVLAQTHSNVHVQIIERVTKYVCGVFSFALKAQLFMLNHRSPNVFGCIHKDVHLQDNGVPNSNCNAKLMAEYD